MKHYIPLIGVVVGFGVLIIFALRESAPEPGPTAEQSAKSEKLIKARQRQVSAASARKNYAFYREMEDVSHARLRATVRDSKSEGERLLALEDMKKLEAKWEAEEARIARIESGEE